MSNHNRDDRHDRPTEPLEPVDPVAEARRRLAREIRIEESPGGRRDRTPQVPQARPDGEDVLHIEVPPRAPANRPQRPNAERVNRSQPERTPQLPAAPPRRQRTPDLVISTDDVRRRNGAGAGPRQELARPAISLRNVRLVRRRAEGQFQLEIPQLDLHPRELTYIGGASGCGKSTLIKLLALEGRPDSGEMVILDQPIAWPANRVVTNLRGEGITYLSQGDFGLLGISPLENIARPLFDYNGVSQYEARTRALAALEAVGLPPDCFDKGVLELSGGQRARVALAKAFALRRPICLADEVLAALDAASRLEMVRFFRRYAEEESITAAFIAHQPDLQPFFHRVILMEAGRIIEDRRNPR